MVQVLKDSVREQIFIAAEEQFAKVGFKKATMGAIAQAAGVATGTIYKYFKTKKELFQLIITDDFVEEFSSLTRNRVAAFAQSEGLSLGQSAMTGEAGELFRFWIRNRRKVIIILARAEGSKHEKFAQKYILNMTAQTIEQARQQFPEMNITNTFRFMVNKILTESVRGIVAILDNFEDEKAICEAFAASTTYQLAGINAFIAWSQHPGRF
ncbi:TetR/AcrR family transcriptional regulator [Desulfovibrio gilichinskyi]|uniref:Transcriptional regulator, TetR family n=1 Tax=Desulfovibrio gilichinskyi TaxID=1519643 RepID=A0A1X7CUK5_9BACT|nr:TetR/AcrR family transcriptional regulator [Desulfovibrio gilichinskyi]SMF03116.1 transcriptional regulator, TetR family [Desulfovibrio gilichinskyi]